VPILFAVAILLCAGGFLLYKSDVFGSRASEQKGEAGLAVTISSDLLDFGVVPMHGVVARRLVIKNDGPEPLHARVIAKDPVYTVRPERLALAPGKPTSVTVTAEPRKEGDLAAELLIRVDGAGTLVVALQGKAEAALLASNRSQQGAEILGADGRGAAGSGAGQLAGDAAGDSRRIEDRSSVGTRSIDGAANPRNQPSSSDAGIVPDSTDMQGVPQTTDAAGREERRGRGSAEEPDGARFGSGVAVLDITEEPPPPPLEISSAEKETARPIPEKTPAAEDLNELPEREASDSEPQDLDTEELEERTEREEDDPFTQPLFTISGASTISLIGHSNYFYPQDVVVVGADLGGPLTLVQPILFPGIPMAFGETMQFSQVGGVGGTFDPASGRVDLQLSMAAVDADGASAPMTVLLTTDTTYARNEAGIVVSITGSPRMPDSGILKLVGIQTIPLGFSHSAEGHLVAIEILGQLTFGTQVTQGSSFGQWP
jgi:hypothetical protein